MILVGIQEVRIAKLVLPGNFKASQETPEVEALATSIETFGVLNEPAVVKSTMTPLYGLYTIAAVALLKRPTLYVKMVELETGDDLGAIRFAADVAYGDKRHERSVEIAAMFQVCLAEVVAKHPDMPLRGAGARKTAEGLAREELGRRLGMLPSSVAASIRRAAVRKPKPKAGDPLPFDTLGLAVPPDFLAVVRERQGQAQLALAGLRSAMAVSARWEPTTTTVALRERTASALTCMRDLMPVSVCFFCKLIPEVRAECLGCRGQGWLGDHAVRPPHLLDRENVQVNYRGKAAPVAEFGLWPVEMGELEPFQLPEGDEGMAAGNDPEANAASFGGVFDPVDMIESLHQEPTTEEIAEAEDWLGGL